MSQKKASVNNQKSNLKKETTWKNNMFSRYMLFRYSLALFFFSNLYWIMILLYRTPVYLLFPISLLLILILATAEQFRLYGKKEVSLFWTKHAFQAQVAVNLLTVVIVLLPNQMAVAFPVLKENWVGILFVIVIQGLGIALSCFNLRHASRVEEKTDKFYIRFQKSFGDFS